MHPTARKAIAEFIARTSENWPNKSTADLGALNISGSVKEQLPNAVGFDIVAGDSVDVVVRPGLIPPTRRHRFGAVLAVSSFQFCAEPLAFRAEVLQLIAPGGYFMVTMCGEQCVCKHRTSQNDCGWGDELRWPFLAFLLFWDTVLTTVRVEQRDNGHEDMIYWGRKT